MRRRNRGEPRLARLRTKPSPCFQKPHSTQRRHPLLPFNSFLRTDSSTENRGLLFRIGTPCVILLAFVEDFIRIDHPPGAAYRAAQSAVTWMGWLEDRGIIEVGYQCLHLVLMKLKNTREEFLAEAESGICCSTCWARTRTEEESR